MSRQDLAAGFQYVREIARSDPFGLQADCLGLCLFENDFVWGMGCFRFVFMIVIMSFVFVIVFVVIVIMDVRFLMCMCMFVLMIVLMFSRVSATGCQQVSQEHTCYILFIHKN